MMRKMLVAAVVAGIGLCEAQMHCENDECTASRKLVQKSSKRRQTLGTEQHDAELPRTAGEAAENQTERERELLLENQAHEGYAATVTDLPDDFWVGYESTWNYHGECAGYRKNFHSWLCSKGCKLGQVIENEITKELCSDGKLKVSKIEPAGYLEKTTCGQTGYVKFECAAVKAKVVTIRSLAKNKRDLFPTKATFTVPEPMNCGFYAGDRRMELNGDIKGTYKVAGHKNYLQDTVNLEVRMDGEKIFVEAKKPPNKKYNIHYSMELKSGWEKTVKLACLPYGSRKGASNFWTRYWSNENCNKFRYPKTTNYANPRDQCMVDECEMSSMKWDSSKWRCHGDLWCSGECIKKN
eukprot:CAMPEP_0172872066 /NCGR_PEP_ID=MMETSP1075-20121228/92435_1 /TAXON_ID=2916 /ORGANISM="Ceratium fusus, Strain PA161109" /LENGTH=352 /DNA_ID=CAMNT_0013722373 /DNA_START=21 /DNA_END=1079 /DNA_ORIENTATION=+